jgi:hypothetical protein
MSSASKNQERLLATATRSTSGNFAAAVRKTLPKSQRLSAADVARLKQEHAQMVEPAQHAAAQALTFERRLPDMVNSAYGLRPEEVALMWATAPPRMPFKANNR